MFIRSDRKRPVTLLTLYTLAVASLYVALLPVVGPLANARYADWHPNHTHGPAATSGKHLHAYEMYVHAGDARGHGHGEEHGPAGHGDSSGHGNGGIPHLLPSDGLGLGMSMVQMAYFGRFAPLWQQPRPSSFAPVTDDVIHDGAVIAPLEQPPAFPER